MIETDVGSKKGKSIGDGFEVCFAHPIWPICENQHDNTRLKTIFSTENIQFELYGQQPHRKLLYNE